jgi:hypothetical protein
LAKAIYEMEKIDPKPFADLIGEDCIAFVFEHAPQKVTTRVARALDHYSRAPLLTGIDEEMGAIRLIAGEEELVVAIFEWLKLNEEQFPEHRDFVRKFKNHVVKLSFYPVLSQIRFILQDMLERGFTLDGLESIVSWTAAPLIDGAGSEADQGKATTPITANVRRTSGRSGLQTGAGTVGNAGRRGRDLGRGDRRPRRSRRRRSNRRHGLLRARLHDGECGTGREQRI